MAVLRAANLVAAFALELCALLACAYWGIHAGTTPLVQVTLAVAAPLAFAVVWGLAVAPKAVVRIAVPAREAVRFAAYAAACVALALADQPGPGALLAAAVVANEALLHALGGHEAALAGADGAGLPGLD